MVTSRRRGLLAGLAGAVAGLGLGGMKAAPREDVVDDIVARLDTEVAAWLDGPGQPLRPWFDELDKGQGAMARQWAMSFLLKGIQERDAAGTPQLVREYRDWLAVPTVVKGSSDTTLRYEWSVAAWHPDRLRNPELQRGFVRNKLAWVRAVTG